MAQQRERGTLVRRREAVSDLGAHLQDVGYGSGLRSTGFTALKMAVLAPIPRASVSTATAVKPGLFASVRTAKRRSWRSVFIIRTSRQPSGRLGQRGATGRSSPARSRPAAPP